MIHECIDIKQHEVYLTRDEPSDLPIVGVTLDERLMMDEDGIVKSYQKPYFFNGLILTLKKLPIKLYPVMLSDFHMIHHILPKLDGLIIGGGRDINPKYYD